MQRPIDSSNIGPDDAHEPPTAIPASQIPPTVASGSEAVLEPPIDPLPASAPPIPDAPPKFNPYFTLLTNNHSSLTHHPTVRYIFADDPPDASPITAAALDLLDPSTPTPDNYSSNEAGNEATTTESQAKIDERYVLLDIDETGTKVISAQSMSPDWAVTAAQIGQAPTWEGEADGQQRGMLLKIEGVEMRGRGADEQGRDRQSLEDLVEEYQTRMGDLRRVVGQENYGGDLRAEEEGRSKR